LKENYIRITDQTLILMYFADSACYLGFQVKPQNSLLTANNTYRAHHNSSIWTNI